MKITAIIIALNEAEFIVPCISSIYKFCDSIMIQSGYNCGFSGTLLAPDDTVNKILAFPDPDLKISLHISRIPDEAIARNWLMKSSSYKIDHPHLSTTSSTEKIQAFISETDYFWIIDADEIYDPRSVPNILSYLGDVKPNVLKIRGLSYFKKWNYLVVPNDGFYQPGFVKRNVLFHCNRYIFPPFWYKLFANKFLKDTRFSAKLLSFFNAVRKNFVLPESIGVFHHGSYVGDNQRISKKINFSTHKSEMMKNWYQNVWLKFDLDARNLHPVDPIVFGGVEYIQTKNLPESISKFPWPEGYIDI